MGKLSKKKKLKALQYEVSTLKALLSKVAQHVGFDGQEHEPVKLKTIEPYEEFKKKLRETEAKYALKASWIGKWPRNTIPLIAESSDTKKGIYYQ